MRCIGFLNKKEMIEMNYIFVAVVAVVVVVIVNVVGVVFRNLLLLIDITFKVFKGFNRFDVFRLSKSEKKNCFNKLILGLGPSAKNVFYNSAKLHVIAYML